MQILDIGDWAKWAFHLKVDDLPTAQTGIVEAVIGKYAAVASPDDVLVIGGLGLLAYFYPDAFPIAACKVRFCLIISRSS